MPEDSITSNKLLQLVEGKSNEKLNINSNKPSIGIIFILYLNVIFVLIYYFVGYFWIMGLQ